MDKTVYTVFDLRSSLMRIPGNCQILLRTEDKGLQVVHMVEVTRGGRPSIVLEPVGVPCNLVTLAALEPGERFRFQNRIEDAFEIVAVNVEPNRELKMEIKSVNDGWRGHIGLSTGEVDWDVGTYYDTKVYPLRRGEDRSKAVLLTGPVPERRADR